ncbi:Uncharacterised protein [Candidatus Anstonella stagnisolia]|nr:Uncharacterised protein [Candidatus Anstonella stagnisolia]
MEENTHEDAKSSHEFISQITALKAAEGRAAKAIEDAKAGAEKILKDAKEKAVNIQSKASDSAVDAKNAAISKGRKDVDKQISSMLAKAEAEGKKISSRSIDKHSAQTLAEGVF